MELLKTSNKEIWFTIGPSSNSDQIIEKIIHAGASGVRLTFSYGDRELHEKRAIVVEEASNSVGKNCIKIADIPGEKIRLGNFGEYDEVFIEKGDDFSLVREEFNSENGEFRIPVLSSKFFDSVAENDVLNFGDGAVTSVVKNVKKDEITLNVLQGGHLNPNRGVSVQDSSFEPRTLTNSDRKDLQFIAKSQHFDAVALSFVSSANDIHEAREVLSSHGEERPIAAKVETKKGLENIDAIANAADVVIIARGDLALYLPWESLGINVMKIVEECQRNDTPWIIATQIVEGLNRFSFPTRAEICDLSQWVGKGTAGIMLSYETAFGSQPVQAVNCTKKVIDQVEGLDKNPWA